MSVSRTKKILVPLATLTVAGAIAVGSGATFTSTSGNTISAVTSGSLTQSNSKDNAAIFTLTNMKPGDTVIGSLTITNTGTLPANFSLTETPSANALRRQQPQARHHQRHDEHAGLVGQLRRPRRRHANALGEFAAGAANTYRFTVTLDAAAPNSRAGQVRQRNLHWDATQKDAQTFDQSDQS